jgi:hypothetical protein
VVGTRKGVTGWSERLEESKLIKECGGSREHKQIVKRMSRMGRLCKRQEGGKRKVVVEKWIVREEVSKMG